MLMDVCITDKRFRFIQDLCNEWTCVIRWLDFIPRYYQLGQQELQVGGRRLSRSHVEMRAANVLGERRGQGLRNERTPVSTLRVKGLMAQPLHEVDKDPRAVAEMKAHFGRGGWEAVSRKAWRHDFEDEVLIRSLI